MRNWIGLGFLAAVVALLAGVIGGVTNAAVTDIGDAVYESARAAGADRSAANAAADAAEDAYYYSSDDAEYVADAAYRAAAAAGAYRAAANAAYDAAYESGRSAWPAAVGGVGLVGAVFAGGWLTDYRRATTGKRD